MCACVFLKPWSRKVGCRSEHRSCERALLQDVKTYTAACLAHVLRLHTADCPYSPAQQQVWCSFPKTIL